jgi:hypothetical protein
VRTLLLLVPAVSMLLVGGCGNGPPAHSLETSGVGGATTTRPTTTGTSSSSSSGCVSQPTATDVLPSPAAACGNIDINDGGAFACGCSYSQPANDAGCGPRMLDAPLCCASVEPAWPESGGSCVCQGFSCSGSEGDCKFATTTIDVSGNPVPGTTQSCTGGLCCAQYLSDGFVSCECGADALDCAELDGGAGGGQWLPVCACTPAAVGCWPGHYARTIACR